MYLVFLVIVIVIAGLSEEILKWHTLLLFEGIYGHWNGNPEDQDELLFVEQSVLLKTSR